jgi:hypothetical protein
MKTGRRDRSKKTMRFLTPGLGFYPRARPIAGSVWVFIWAPTNFTAILEDLLFHCHAYRCYSARRRLGIPSVFEKGLRFISRWG